MTALHNKMHKKCITYTALNPILTEVWQKERLEGVT